MICDGNCEAAYVVYMFSEVVLVSPNQSANKPLFLDN